MYGTFFITILNASLLFSLNSFINPEELNFLFGVQKVCVRLPGEIKILGSPQRHPPIAGNGVT